MKKIATIFLILSIGFNAWSLGDGSSLTSELSSSYSTGDQVTGKHFSKSDFKNIFIDLAIVAGIYFIGKKMPKDKRVHFYAGAVSGAVVGKWCQKKQDDISRKRQIKKSFMCSLGAATAVGVLKEVYDSTGRGNVEFADAFVTSAGGVAAGLLFL